MVCQNATKGHSQKEDQGYVDSGCSRHMTGNMSCLSDFKEFEWRICYTWGPIKEGKLQMCDKKNSIVFTDTRCFVLSPDFKLADESQATTDLHCYGIGGIGKATQSLLFTWVFILATKDETRGILKRFLTETENLVDKKVKIIRCDNGTEFKNKVMSEFCEEKGIKKEFSAARTMLADSKLPTTFWVEEVNTASYVQNMVLVVKPHNKTPYELFRGRTPALSFMRPFGCQVTILNTLDYLGKFDGKSDEGFFVGYLMNSKAFKVYNIRTRKVEENLHIRFLEDKPIIAGDGPKWLFDIDVLTKSMNYMPVVAGTNSDDFIDGSLFDSSSKNASNDKPQPSSDAGKKNDEGVCKESGIDDQEKLENSTQDINTARPMDMSNITTTYPVPSTPNTRIHKDHSFDHVIGDIHSGVQTRRMTKTTNEQCWIEAMQDELLQFKLQKVWTLVDLPYGMRAIETKWVYRNKKDERGIIMDVKSAFLYAKFKKEVYVCQPPAFEDPEFPDRVYKVEKALYHQAPGA
ncbi:putative ribonuclease H-like domain-containing protein, partial [Tanacetum coccineum]